MAIVRTRRVIDDAGADAVIGAAERYANEAGHRVVIAVVDPSGELIQMRRTPGAQIASSRVALDKARTAAIFVRPSREMEEQVTNGRLGALALHGASCLTGGIPLRVGDEVVGAIGTSGETPDEDEAVSLAAAAAGFSVREVPALTYEGAKLAAEAIGAEAARRGVAPVVSAVDAGGALIYLLRPDSAQVASVEVTTDKARTAAIYRRPSKDFEDQASGGRPSALHLARAVPLQGGMPISRDGEVIGAVGVSGATSADEDQELAVLGVEAVEAVEAGTRDSANGAAYYSSGARVNSAARLPGPPELLPGRPDAMVDLQTEAGATLVGGRWRYSDARVAEVDFVALGSESDPLGPGDAPNRTYDVLPHAEAADYDDSGWQTLAPAGSRRRLSDGRVCFNWYRISVEIPARVGDFDPTGSTVVFEVVIDDYAEVWVDGELPHALGDTGGPVVGGFNAPNRVVLTRDARPGDRFQIAVFGINGPISASPANYIWMRTATLDFYARERAGSAEPLPDLPDGTTLERVAGGFEFTEGPVWSPADGALLFSSPNTNAIYRLDPELGRLTVFRSKSGYTGVDIGRYPQPGSNGLAFDPEGRLAICQHGNRRVIRVNPHGDITVLADTYEGRRLNSPNDLVYRSDGTLFFTDPPFGLPDAFDDPDRELDFSGVFERGPDGLSLVDDSLEGPNGIALSPDERYLYAGNWDLEHKVVVRYELATGERAVLADLTGEPGDDAIDGIKVDPSDGRLFVCGPGGIWILSPEGERLGRLTLPEDPHNLAWGGADGRDLYVTALTSVYRLRPERSNR